MHSPVNLIAFNAVYRDRIADAETARLARAGKPAAPRHTAGSRSRRPWALLLRRPRTA
jgi:hypothetical protein